MDAENRSDQQKNFDRWLDAALHARADAEPRGGLEERVLARLAFAHEPRARWWLPMAMASAAVIVIAVAIALLHPAQPQPIMSNRSTQAITPATADRALLNASSVSSRESIHKRTHSLASASKDRSCCGSTRVVARAQSEGNFPKLASFPTAHPETEQERLLAQLASQLEAQGQSSEIARLSIDSPPKDLSVTELQIEPLETTSSSGNPQE